LQFQFDCKLLIGDGSTTTWFKDTEKEIVFSDGIVTGSGQYWIGVNKNAHFHIGVLDSSINKWGSKGCTFIYEESVRVNCYMIQGYATSPYDDVKLYGSTFNSLNGRQYICDLKNNQPIYNCLFIHKVLNIH